MNPRPDRSERGITLVEMIVTVTLLAVVMAILLPQVSNALTTFERQSTRSSALDQANLGLARVERDVFASGAIIICSDATPPETTPPSGALPSGFALVLAPGSQPGASVVQYWVDWSSATNGLALRRATAATAVCPATFPAVGESIVRGLANSVGTLPFTATCSGRSIDLNFVITGDSTTSTPATILTSSLVTGRGVQASGSTTCL